MKKVALHNLGCKVNAYEMDAMQEMLEEHGYEIVPFEKGADIYIINTCTVTNIADRKSRQMLHKAKKMNPDAIVVAAGCYAQISGENAKVDECIDLLVGNNNKKNIVSILQEYEESHKEEAYFDINAKGVAYENLRIAQTAGNTRAYVKVQDGCNQFCSYCIIPYARGRARSRSRQEILEELSRLSDNGYKEVVLTGIHLTSYGLDFPEEENLLELIKAVHQVEGIERIRLGSLEPRIITEEFVKILSGLAKICPHFHLSLQSGCDDTLKRMNRHYTTEQYMEGCGILRRFYEHPAITTDIITGFPGETEEEFAKTVDFVKQMNFYETHVFKYSRRQGTRAAEMENQIPEPIKGTRSDVLLALDRQNSKKFREYYLNKHIEALMEEAVQIKGDLFQIGHTREYVKVAVKTEKNLSNTMQEGRITGFLKDDILLFSED